MRIKIIRDNLLIGKTCYRTDDIVDVDDETGKRLVGKGHAEEDHTGKPALKAQVESASSDYLASLDFLNDEQRSTLFTRDLDTEAKLKAAFESGMDLTKVPTVGAGTVKKLRKSLGIE